MHPEAHAGVGWLIGVLAPSSDRRLRNWCLVAALLPDIDAAAYLFGPVAYMNYHHTFGHNIFLGLACTAAAALHHRGAGVRRAVLAAGIVALAFAAHILGDMKLSAYPVVLFWPLSHAEYEIPLNYALGAPINTWLFYASFALVPVLALWRKVTPLDVIATRLDRIFIGFFRARPLACSACGGRCNQRCDGCGEPVCFRHGRLGRGFRIACPRCEAGRGV